MKLDLDKIFGKVHNFDEKVKGEIHGDEFFKDYYNLLFGTDNTKGVFYELADILFNDYLLIKKNRDETNKSLTLWINFSTYLIKKNLIELNNSDYVEYDRLIPPIDENNSNIAFIDKGRDNDISAHFFSEYITKKGKKLTTQLLFSSSNGKVKCVEIENKDGELKWRINNKEEDFEKYIKSTCTTNSDDASLNNYITLIKNVFAIEDNNDDINCDFVPAYAYMYNLSPPAFSDFFGTLMIFSKDDINPDFKSNTIFKIKELFHSLKIIELKYLQERKLYLFTYASTKSALAAIMARNMSHNLGSHFLTNTKNYFANIAEQNNSADLRGVKHVLQYIQERMDFVATVVSNDIFPFGPVNFKAQIFDELKIDDAGKRHNKLTTNFLLDFLVSSEQVSKNSKKLNGELGILQGEIELDINIIYHDEDSKKNIMYAGTIHEMDQKVKLKISNINYAVPGGILGRHAIFNIIENIIRNSAKHDSNNIQGGKLLISIKLEKDRIIVFDNKKNAYSKIRIQTVGKKGNIVDESIPLIEYLKQQLLGIEILKDNGEIDKKNKGLKEMLISALWLKNEDVSKWFSTFDKIKESKERVEKLESVFGLVAIDMEGNEIKALEEANLGYYFKIDPFETKKQIVARKNLTYTDIKSVKADIITCTEDIKIGCKQISDIYPRFITNKENGKDLCLFKRIIEKNTLIDPDKVRISIIHSTWGSSESSFNFTKLNKSTTENNDNNISTKKDVDEELIVFKNHFGKKQAVINDNDEIKKHNQKTINDILNTYKDAIYLDAISGENFTSTIVNPDFLNDEINRLKVIESALTGIAIIDERIYNNYGGKIKKHGSIQSISDEKNENEIIQGCNSIINKAFLSKKTRKAIRSEILKVYPSLSAIQVKYYPEKKEQIDGFIQKLKEYSRNKISVSQLSEDVQQRILNKQGLFIYNIEIDDNCAALFDISGNKLSSITQNYAVLDFSVNKIQPLFLAIHLSLIEKIAKQTDVEKADEIMTIIKRIFPSVKFITIHSGRGNLSEEFEIALKDYAFMSLSAIEAALYNSKYFLSQLFYNTNYYGKGNINH